MLGARCENAGEYTLSACSGRVYRYRMKAGRSTLSTWWVEEAMEDLGMETDGWWRRVEAPRSKLVVPGSRPAGSCQQHPLPRRH